MASPLAMILAEADKRAPSPPQPTVQPTNVAGIYANNDSQNMDAYKAQIAQQNAQFGALASLGSAAIGAGGSYLGSQSTPSIAGYQSVGNYQMPLVGSGWNLSGK